MIPPGPTAAPEGRHPADAVQRELSVVLSPVLLAAEGVARDSSGYAVPRLAGQAVAVIDLFRATTTMAAALTAGARAVWAVETVEQARSLARELIPRRGVGTTSAAVLGGERGGVAVEGFDLGNSPGDYTASRVGGRDVVLTTTNGTVAMSAAARAGATMLVPAALANLGVVAGQLRLSRRNVSVVCAGLHGQPALEDTAAAGALVERLIAEPAAPGQAHERWALDDGAKLALAVWRGLAPDWNGALREAAGGRNIADLGLAADLDICLRVDGFPTAGFVTNLELAGAVGVPDSGASPPALPYLGTRHALCLVAVGQLDQG